MFKDQQAEAKRHLVIREPQPRDAMRLNRLILQLSPLASNSVYCNLLQSSHFADTSALAEQGGKLVGFVTAYLHPQKPDTLFVWQVGVSEICRGQGLPRTMIQHILARPRCRGVRTLEATVSSGNSASKKMFESLARAEGAEYVIEEEFYPADIFGESETFAEDLVRIEPLSTPKRALRRDDQ
ncbi:diaminobutyrate acetyltransferase [Proteobacteria bacterium 005FR1]|nr:diaminobutyrate acetyltransferase [Proteobacteria bacterium 005FR1]